MFDANDVSKPGPSARAARESAFITLLIQGKCSLIRMSNRKENWTDRLSVSAPKEPESSATAYDFPERQTWLEPSATINFHDETQNVIETYRPGLADEPESYPVLSFI
jgi:hypothetical protein